VKITKCVSGAETALARKRPFDIING